MNDIWGKLTDFLGTLNGENTSRRDYVTTPEYKEAEKQLAEAEEKWVLLIKKFSDSDQKEIDAYIECLEKMACKREQRAYLQGCADCVQVLAKMGLLKENNSIAI